MKKKTLAIIVIAAALVIALSIVAIICISNRKPKPSSDNVASDYNNILDDLYGALLSPNDEDALFDGVYSIQEAALALGDKAMDKLEYIIKDINNDGTEDLVIGCFDTDASASTKNEIYAAYSHDGDHATLLFEKQAQNTFALTNTNTYYFYGSDGTNYNIIAEYEIGENGRLTCKDFYFTYPKSEAANGFAYYHNTSGKWDPEVSEELNMTAEEFEAIRDKLASKTVELSGVKVSSLKK
jgi:hypothetical protein